MVPLVSLADALRVMVAGAVNVAPDAGAVIDTEGGEFVGVDVDEPTFKVRGADIVDPPLLSRATAVNTYVPALRLRQEMLYLML